MIETGTTLIRMIHRNMHTRASKCVFVIATMMICIGEGSLRGQVFLDSVLVGRRIDAIQIHGNQKTKASIILREMKSCEGDTLDEALLMEDQKRIQNLNLFNRVTIFAQYQDRRVIVHVHVTEQWYIFPYPIFFINERDWDKLSYGAGLKHFNFRGRAEILDAFFWLGYNPSVQLDYINPWIGGRHHLSLRTNIYFQKVRSKHYRDEEVTENHKGVYGILGKRFGYHTHLNMSLSYREVTFSPSDSGQTLSPDGRDRLPSLGLSLVWDHRDLIEYPHSGWYVYFSAVKTGVSSMTADYLFYGFDTRAYVPLGRTTLAFRLASDVSHGKIPLYDRLYIGYNERVRGHFFEAFEGENRALASAAFRIPLIPVRYVDLGDQSQMMNLKFGLSLGFFIDTGTVWFQSEGINDLKFQTGYGVGLHMHLPYINVLRFEMAFNQRGRKQFILDMGVDI